MLALPAPDHRPEPAGLNLFRALATVSSLTLLSRITGLARDMLISRLFGSVQFLLGERVRRIISNDRHTQPLVSGDQWNPDNGFCRIFPDVIDIDITDVIGMERAPGYDQGNASFDQAVDQLLVRLA